MKYTKGMRNFMRIMKQSRPHEKIEGYQAFDRLNVIAKGIAEEYGKSVKIGAAIFSTLSPNNDMKGNIRDVRRVLKASTNGLPSTSFKVSTYTMHKVKALKIANGELDPDKAFKYPKTYNFYHNILDPSEPTFVTIDGHVLNAWKFQRKNLSGNGMNRTTYDQVANDIRKLAHSMDLKAHQLQGCLWFTWRRIHSIKTTSQLEMWDPDYVTAGLGFHPDTRDKIQDKQSS